MAFEQTSFDLGTLQLGQMVLIPLNVADLNKKRLTITLGCGSCTSFIQNQIENYSQTNNIHYLTNIGDVFNLSFTPNSTGLNSKTAVINYKTNDGIEQVANIQWFANVV